MELQKSHTEDLVEEYSYIFIGLLVGYFLRFLARQAIKYIEKQPNILNSDQSNESNPSIPKPKKRFSRIRIIRKLRGGAFKILAILDLLSELAVPAGMVGGILKFLSRRSKEKILSTIYESSPQNLDILFTVLNDPSIPFEQKQRVTYRILAHHVDLTTHSGRVKFVLCIVAIIIALSIANPAGYMILLQQLVKLVKAKKISKVVLRAILRKLKGKNVLIDPDLLN